MNGMLLPDFSQAVKQTPIRYLLPLPYERDAGFRDVIRRYSKVGARTAGILGVLSITAVMFGYVVTERSFTWTYGGIDPSEAVVLWDKLIVLLLSLATIAVSHLRPEWTRLLVSLFAVAIAVALMADDIATGRTEFTAGYLMLTMLAAAGTLPYQPWQSLLVSASITILYIVTMEWASTRLDLVDLQVSRIVTLVVTTFIATGISSVLYVSRYRQYDALRRANVLRKRARAHEAELHEIERIKSRFFANLSHEFRTPLTLLLGPIEDALAGEYGPLDDRLRKQLPAMQRSGLRLQRHIDELLELARMDAHRMKPDPRPTNLTALVSEAVSRFAAPGERKGVTVDTHSEPEEIITSVDASIVDKIVDNLLSNALKFTPMGGRVRVMLSETTGAVEIRVRDTGQGIPSEDLPHIFDRFYRGDDPGSQDQASTGIGLSLVHELIKLCGGNVYVESEPGFGSEFTVRLPVVETGIETHGGAAAERSSSEEALSDAAAASSVPHTVVAGDRKRRTPDFEHGDSSLQDMDAKGPGEDAPLILVVEDDDDVRTYVIAQFAATYRTAEAGDGRAGLDRVRELKPNLVISDVMMPGMDGLDLCRTIKSDATLNHIPVVLLTARTTHEDLMDGLGVGADDYIYKPFSAAELRTRAENLLEIRHLLRERYMDRILLEPSSVNVTSAEAEFVEQVVTIVDQHIADSNFGVDWLADELSLSARQLQRKLRKTTRLSAAGLIRLMRMKRAADLLKGGAGTMKDIANAVGYRDADYFSRVFGQLYGVPPSLYDGTQTASTDRRERDVQP